MFLVINFTDNKLPWADLFAKIDANKGIILQTSSGKNPSIFFALCTRTGKALHTEFFYFCRLDPLIALLTLRGEPATILILLPRSPISVFVFCSNTQREAQQGFSLPRSPSEFY